MIAGYNFINKLGRGSFGEVWLAEEQAGRIRVAVKLLHNLQGDALDRFRREVRLLSENIDNKFIVNILNHDLYATPPYVVMEYCEGARCGSGWASRAIRRRRRGYFPARSKGWRGFIARAAITETLSRTTCCWGKTKTGNGSSKFRTSAWPARLIRTLRR